MEKAENENNNNNNNKKIGRETQYKNLQRDDLDKTTFRITSSTEDLERYCGRVSIVTLHH